MECLLTTNVVEKFGSALAAENQIRVSQQYPRYPAVALAKAIS
jgi:hypothetical protein